MTYLEKRAWIELSIIFVTLALYGIFISRGKLDPISLSIFALAGFLGFARGKRRKGEVLYDERDRQIERHALLSSLIVFYMLVAVFSVVAAFTNGWDAAVPIWMVVQIFWAAALAIWAVKDAIIIVQYRRSAHA